MGGSVLHQEGGELEEEDAHRVLRRKGEGGREEVKERTGRGEEEANFSQVTQSTHEHDTTVM